MKAKYYIGTEEVSKEVYDTVQMYKEMNLDLIEEKVKYKKALEIINDKRVDMTSLKESLALDKEVLYYNNDRRFGKKLTKEEYELLKEILL